MISIKGIDRYSTMYAFGTSDPRWLQDSVFTWLVKVGMFLVFHCPPRVVHSCPSSFFSMCPILSTVYLGLSSVPSWFERWDEMTWDEIRWDGMRWDGMGWDGMGRHETARDGTGWDKMGWHGMRWDEIRWDGMRWDEIRWVGWDELRWGMR